MALVKTIRSKKPLIDAPKFRRDLTRIMQTHANALVRRMQYYPKQQIGKHMKFKSEKQRRYFFYALRKGIIHVPYQRTDKLKLAWKPRVVEHSGRIVAEVTNDRRYASFVQGRTGQQTSDMRGRNWRRIDEQAKKEWDSNTMPKLRKLFRSK